VGQGDRAAPADPLGRRGVIGQGSGVGGEVGAPGADDLGQALEGPAGDPVRRARYARRRLDGDREVDLVELLVPAVARRLGGEQDREVGRQRLEPAHLHDLDPGIAGALVELVDDLTHERDLAREVDVIGAAVDAGLDHRPAAGRVRAREVEDDGGPRRHLAQRGRVGEVGGDRLRVGGADLGQCA
jgi:hypothetical protein